MITQEMNDRLTRVGSGTPMGTLLRRYWHVIAAAGELDEDPVRPVRILGEDLVLFRDAAGKLGLVAERCAHRGISLAYGIPQENGLRCAYHGWVYNPQGQVVDMPFEPACLPLKIQSYPVQEMGGLIFGYLGPDPVPLLPKHELYVREDMHKSVEIVPLPCNWLQAMDNSLDPVHYEHLHGVYGNYVLSKLGNPPAMFPAKHVRIAFDVFEYGIYKRRLLEGESEEIDDWTLGHPIIFPNILLVGDAEDVRYQIRVPVDDTHTMHYRYRAWPKQPGDPEQKGVPIRRRSLFDADGSITASSVPKQDELAWVAQGPISDRTTSHLVSSDQGINLYYKLLLEQIEVAERGDDPMGVVRDRSRNESLIRIPWEDKAKESFYPDGGRDRGFWARNREEAAV